MVKKRWHNYWQSIRSVYPDHKQYRIFVVILLLGLGISVLAFHVFLELAAGLRAGLLGYWDALASSWILEIRQPELTGLVKVGTQLGGFYVYALLIGGITWYTHLKEKGWTISIQVLTVLTTTALLNLVLKLFIDRARPQDIQLVEAVGQSFPSGHSMSSIAFYGFIIYLVWLHHEHRGIKIILSLLLILLILLVGFTRVYLGVHYPSDVVAGYAAGLSWLAICIWIFNWLNHRKLRKMAEVRHH